MKKGKDGVYSKYVKRVLDVICALLAMTVFCWLYGILALLVRIKLGSPVIFKQERPGLNEKIFTLYKFRTMTNGMDANGNLLSDEERLTKFGRLLRSTSLDELPEVWNILKGDMSVIGPRPLLVSYLLYYTKEEHRRHDVRPGLSGMAQVSGRNALTWNERLKLDEIYVQTLSFWGDVKIVFLTAFKVLFRKDVQSGNEMQMQDLNVERSQYVRNHSHNSIY